MHRHCVEEEYERKQTIFAALKQEVRYVLEQETSDRNLKIHSIEDRIKSLDSIIEKAQGRDLSDPLRDLVDIVGVRVVVLFRSDLAIVDEIVRKSFNVISVDDKLSDGDGLGYASIHYECQMKAEYSGPRYRRIRGITFEVQVRTICMHAWAVISHYLDYKGEWDVPDHLRRALNALSGLFYVADSEFEVVARAKSEHTQRIERGDAKEQADEGIDLDSVTSYLKRRFPDREQVDPATTSSFVRTIVAAGYETIAQLDAEISAGETELKGTSMPAPYSALATARLLLGFGDEDFFREHYGTYGTRAHMAEIIFGKPKRERRSTAAKGTRRRPKKD